MLINLLKIVCLFLLLIMTGCTNNCCDCDNDITTGEGHLKLVRSWELMWEGLNKPHEIEVYFYNSLHSTQSHKVYSDTTFLNLNTGEYDVLAVNSALNVSFTGLDNWNTAKVSLPVWYEREELVTSEVPLTVATHAFTFIDDQRESECTIYPEPLIKLINFRLIVSRGESVGEITLCNAEFKGVNTSRMLCTEKNLSGNAKLLFTLRETQTDMFEKTVSMLGLSGEVPNDLIVYFESNDENETKEVYLDLTDLFDFSVMPIQNCVIYLSLLSGSKEAYVEAVEITDWEWGIDGDIQLQ